MTSTITLKYGCNPHQGQASFESGALRVRNGAPSMINMLDALNAWQLVAEIGDAIESHMRTIGLIADEPLDPPKRQMVEEKRARFNREGTAGNAVLAREFPDGAHFCTKCHTQRVVRMDGCMTCLNCGESKCG